MPPFFMFTTGRLVLVVPVPTSTCIISLRIVFHTEVTKYRYHRYHRYQALFFGHFYRSQKIRRTGTTGTKFLM